MLNLQESQANNRMENMSWKVNDKATQSKDA